MNTTDSPASHEAYRAARENLDKRLNMINRLVREHDGREFRDRKDWGYTANLNGLIEILNRAIRVHGREDDVNANLFWNEQGRIGCAKPGHRPFPGTDTW